MILQKFSTTNCIIEAFIWLIVLLLIYYFTVVRMYLSDIIIFEDNKIKKAARFMSFSGKIPAFELSCSEITSAKFEMGIYVYLILSAATSKEYKIFIRPFSRKQILKIVTMINERGGQIDAAEINRFLKEEYLFGKKKVK